MKTLDLLSTLLIASALYASDQREADIDRLQTSGVILTQSLPFADPAVLRLYDAFETEVYRAAGERRAA